MISATFVILNIFTLGNLAPWIDEVMLLDTSYNAAVHGSWETTAWYRVAGQYPFSTYPPLYQMLASVWIWLFGGSMVAVRSMNLLFTFVLGGICLRLMRRHGLQPSPWTVALFAGLVWGTSETAWMYRNGRPDMLCALVFALDVLAIDRYLAAQTLTTRLAVIMASALLLCSGIQAAACLLALWLFFFVVMKDLRKKTFRLFAFLFTGISLGMVMVMLFMLAHGRWVAFVGSIIQYSATLSGIALTVLPWASEAFGLHTVPYTQKLLEVTTETSLCERLATVAEDRSFLVLSAVTLVAYVSCFRDNVRRLVGDKGFLMLLCALYVPVIMTLVGRYPIYYRWMAYLPLVIAITFLAARHRLWRAVFGMIAVFLTIFGIRSMLPDEHWDYESMRSFVQRQHFKSTDAVVCPFSTFYEMKPICDTCYFVGIFPPEYIGHVDYIIEAADGYEFDRPITGYVNRLKADTTVVLTVKDHSCVPAMASEQSSSGEHPSLTLYQVQKKHE